MGTSVLADAFVAFRIPNTFRRLLPKELSMLLFIHYTNQKLKSKLEAKIIADEVLTIITLAYYF